MVNKIHVMPEWLQNQIAAGEVVERPASLVKELVENSLDAGARRIVIEVEQGGKQLIRVVDDGSGMSREDCMLALDRHATSKLREMGDLRNITSFGFRGEALPSIASVSEFTLKSRRAEDETGCAITISEDGKRDVTDAPMARGTEVVARSLFHNVPARRKFLKTDKTENRALVETVQRIALSHHSVFFQLISDGRTVLSAPPENEPLARLYSVLGKKVCQQLYECRLEGRIRVSGFVSSPEGKRRGAGGLYTFVNNRFVRDKVIMQAVASGYSGLLGRGEYPYAVLHVDVPPNEVDVNVHPAKSEVRFERSNEVFAAVSRAVKLTLAETPWVRDTLEEASRGPEATGGDHVPGQGMSSAYDMPVLPLPVRGAGPHAPAEYTASEGHPFSAVEHSHEVSAGSLAPGEDVRGFSRLIYLGQYANCYLLGQIGSRLVVIDQHAAHERVVYERLKREFESSRVVSQPLLMPVLVESAPALIAVAQENAAFLERLGFNVEPFGGNSLAIKGAPALMGKRPPELPLMAILDELQGQPEPDAPAVFHTVLATMACHTAVRAGDPMDREEVLALLQQMDSTEMAAYCPHGRPSVTVFPETDVARWFKRT